MKNQNIIIAEITYTLLCQHDSVVKVHNQSIALHNRPQDSRHETKQPDIMLARIPFHTTPFSVAYAIRRYRTLVQIFMLNYVQFNFTTHFTCQMNVDDKTNC